MTLSNLRNTVLMAGIALLPTDMIRPIEAPVSAEESNIKEAIKLTFETCKGVVKDALIKEQFAEEYRGNQRLGDSALQEQMKDLELTGVEWCMNGLLFNRLPGLNATCYVADEANSEFECRTTYSEEVTPRILSSEFMVLPGCEAQFNDMRDWMLEFGAIASRGHVPFEVGNASVERLVNQGMELCASWQVVKPQ